MLQIITDSSAEFTEEEAKELGIQIVPLAVVFGDTAYREGIDMQKDEFYKRLPTEFPHTSMPSTDDFTRAYVQTGGEETLVILISSALSGTINTARLAARDGGFSKVHVYDSLAVTAILRIMVETACKHRDKSAEEVIAILDELRPRIRLDACLDTLEYLYKGGRIKKGVAFIGNLLGIKPLIEICKDGTVGMSGKAHGQKRALKSLVEKLKSAEVDPDYPVYFLQTDVEEPSRNVMEQVGMQDARIFRICCAVGSHIGPNAAGLVYVVKK